ncbi:MULTISPECIES: hypothetical protein [unclassified Lysinibacillus]
MNEYIQYIDEKGVTPLLLEKLISYELKEMEKDAKVYGKDLEDLDDDP